MEKKISKACYVKQVHLMVAMKNKQWHEVFFMVQQIFIVQDFLLCMFLLSAVISTTFLK